MELNPDHPMTQRMHDNWHKIVALLLVKFGVKHVEITSADIEQLAEMDAAITIQEKNSIIHVDLMDVPTAEALLEKEGQVPTCH